MRVISVIQPWASLLVLGLKEVETRSWATKYRGPILIHASAKKMRAVDRVMYHNWVVNHGLPELKEEPIYGAIIGQATLTRCESMDHLTLRGLLQKGNVDVEEALGHYSEGRYMWLMTNPIIFKNPIPAKGRLGLWDYNLPME